jgi:small subunit ribosomal protein S25e
LNNAVYWAKPVWDKLVKDVVAKEAYLTPSVISDKLKVNVSLAREAIRALREDGKIAPQNEYHSKYACFVKTAKYIAESAQEKKEAPAQKGGKQQKA